MNVTKQLYQWDTGQKLTECTGIYVDYLIGDEVYRVEITDGTCIIPDELLQTSGRYKVWECMADNTLREFAFKVLPRPIPPNYVFTPTEQLTFEGLVQKETNKFNTNAIEKLNAYNANADNRVAEFNAQTEQIQADVSELKSDLDNLHPYDLNGVIKDSYNNILVHIDRLEYTSTKEETWKGNTVFADIPVSKGNKLYFVDSGHNVTNENQYISIELKDSGGSRIRLVWLNTPSVLYYVVNDDDAVSANIEIYLVGSNASTPGTTYYTNDFYVLLNSDTPSSGVTSFSFDEKFKVNTENFPQEVKTLIVSNDVVKCVGHRGDILNAPENTLIGFKSARDMGYKYVETDVRFTSDGIAVLLHDESIDRTSDGIGNISDLTYEQVSSYDFGSWKDNKFSGEKIPTFKQFLIVCRRLGLHPYIEVKGLTNDQIDSLCNDVVAYGLKECATFISYNISELSRVSTNIPSMRIGLIITPTNLTDSIVDNLAQLKNGMNEVFIDFDSYNKTAIANITPYLISKDVPCECCLSGKYSIPIVNPYISGFTTDSELVSHDMYDLWNYDI